MRWAYVFIGFVAELLYPQPRIKSDRSFVWISDSGMFRRHPNGEIERISEALH